MKERMRNRTRPGYNECADVIKSPLGDIYIFFVSGVLAGLSFCKPSGIFLKQTEKRSVVKKELAEYFEKGRREFTCKTGFIKGTDFEKKVWNALREVPYGETRTYKWLAEMIAAPLSYRAVGRALGKNPIPIIFPCHRIIESDGSIGGYSAGADIKRRLLDLEYYT